MLRLSFLTRPPQFVLANCVWICTAVSNCINLRSHIRQGPFRRHPSASCIVGNALGRWNQSHWSQEKELIIYWSYTPFSIAPLALSNTAPALPIPLFPPMSSTLSLLTFHLDFLSSNPLSAKHSFFVWCHKPLLLFSCVVAVNNGKMRVLLCGKFTQAFVLVLLPHHNSAGNGSLLPNAEARICTSASVVTLPERSGTAR